MSEALFHLSLMFMGCYKNLVWKVFDSSCCYLPGMGIGRCYSQNMPPLTILHCVNTYLLSLLDHTQGNCDNTTLPHTPSVVLRPSRQWKLDREVELWQAGVLCLCWSCLKSGPGTRAGLPTRTSKFFVVYTHGGKVVRLWQTT